MTTKRKIIFTAGAKGGSGKTTALVSLADFLHANNIPVTLIDSDVENTVRGSLAWERSFDRSELRAMQAAKGVLPCRGSQANHCADHRQGQRQVAAFPRHFSSFGRQFVRAFLAYPLSQHL